MPRARRDWSTMRADIRALLRETTGSTSFWTDADLLIFFNQAMDLRSLEMMAVDEGWFTDRLETDLVADQKEYTLPEGTDRVRRILMQFTDGTTFEIPLIRSERWSEPMVTVGASSTGAIGNTPTVRLVGELIYLEPPPVENRTNGLIIELEGLPTRLTLDGSKLDLKFPSAAETLLIYDTWDIALGVEDAQGNVNPDVRGRLQGFHSKIARAYQDIIESRLNSRYFSSPYYLGD